jgi:hypothetical protein
MNKNCSLPKRVEVNRQQLFVVRGKTTATPFTLICILLPRFIIYSCVYFIIFNEKELRKFLSPPSLIFGMKIFLLL